MKLILGAAFLLVGCSSLCEAQTPADTIRLRGELGFWFSITQTRFLAAKVTEAKACEIQISALEDIVSSQNQGIAIRDSLLEVRDQIINFKDEIIGDRGQQVILLTDDNKRRGRQISWLKLQRFGLIVGIGAIGVFYLAK